MDDKGKPLVSVIVPIYNTQKFLPRCLDSILDQSYLNMEIILIDDGSDDGSLDVCERYAETDGRIRVISQENKGIIAAKRAGIMLCQGTYVMFVDSDDWIETELLEKMVLAMQESECKLVCTSVYQDLENGTVKERRNAIPPGIYEAETIAKDLFYYKDTENYGVLPYSVAKLYPKEMLKEILNHIGDDIHFAEDKAIVFSFVFRDIKICFTDDILYHYCIRNGSVCQSENANYLVELTAIYKYIKKIFEGQKEKEHLLWQLGKWMWLEAGYAINGKLGLATPEKPVYKEPYRIDPSIFLFQKSKIIIYGAGNVGYDYMKQMTDCINIEMVGWVDKQYKKYQEKTLHVQPVEYIKDVEYDYILVAVRKQSIFRTIKNELTETGIAENKIVWGRPYGAPYKDE